MEIGHSGSESDGGIFSRSTLQKEITRGTLGLPPPRTVGSEGLLPYFLVGDEAFPLKDYVMRPYPRRILHEDSHKRHKRRVFNYHLSRARRVIENAFGILAQRWRILRRLFKAKTDNINRYGAACIVLHNFLMKESSASSAAYCPPGSADSEDWEGRLSPGSWREEEPAGGALLPSKSTGCHAARTAGLHVCCHGVRGNPWLVVICCFCSAATTVEKRLFFIWHFTLLHADAITSGQLPASHSCLLTSHYAHAVLQ